AQIVALRKVLGVLQRRRVDRIDGVEPVRQFAIKERAQFDGRDAAFGENRKRTTASMPFSQPSQNQDSATPMRSPPTPSGTRRRNAKESPSCGSSAAKLKAASAMLRARMPGVSKVKLSGTMPSEDQRCLVIFRPALPVIAAGSRTEAAVSLPNANSAEPSHNETPAPLDDPPGGRCVLASQGLYGLPESALWPAPPRANSTICVFPLTVAD